MDIELVMAISEVWVYGRENQLPWKLRDDMAHFRRLTSGPGNAVVMGRRTFESIGRPLPNRLNIVITYNSDLKVPEGCIVSPPKIEIVQWLIRDRSVVKLFVIGGLKVWELFFDVCAVAHITRVGGNPEGNKSIPATSPLRLLASWQWSPVELVISDERNDFPFTIYRVERKT